MNGSTQRVFGVVVLVGGSLCSCVPSGGEGGDELSTSSGQATSTSSTTERNTEPAAETTAAGSVGSGEGTTSGATTGEASSTGAGETDPVIFDVGGDGAEATEGSGEVCDNSTTVLSATIRDFASSHPDFEAFWGGDASLGLVLPDLGMDGTPQYNPAAPPSPPGSSFTQITSAMTFAEWYHDVVGINVAEEIEIALEETPPGSGLFVFDDPTFFPVDGAGWNAAPGPNNETFPDTLGDPHNFHFTTEIHTSFVYEPGQIFTFIGDDDLWVFIDGALAIDLGGLHGELTGEVELDTLGLMEGETYAMDIFHAERRHDGSHFRVETSISCFLPPAG